MSAASVAGLRLGWLRPAMGRSQRIPAGDGCCEFLAASGRMLARAARCEASRVVSKATERSFAVRRTARPEAPGCEGCNFSSLARGLRLRRLRTVPGWPGFACRAAPPSAWGGVGRATPRVAVSIALKKGLAGRGYGPSDRRSRLVDGGVRQLGAARDACWLFGLLAVNTTFLYTELSTKTTTFISDKARQQASETCQYGTGLELFVLTG